MIKGEKRIIILFLGVPKKIEVLVHRFGTNVDGVEFLAQIDFSPNDNSPDIRRPKWK